MLFQTPWVSQKKNSQSIYCKPTHLGQGLLRDINSKVWSLWVDSASGWRAVAHSSKLYHAW